MSECQVSTKFKYVYLTPDHACLRPGSPRSLHREVKDLTCVPELYRGSTTGLTSADFLFLYIPFEPLDRNATIAPLYKHREETCRRAHCWCSSTLSIVTIRLTGDTYDNY